MLTEKEQIDISEKMYQLIKKYRTIDSNSGLHISRGIMTCEETWLLDELEKIIFGKILV